MQRVAVYIDGFNLFYGLKSKRRGRRGKRWPCYYWLDVRRMSENLLIESQKLVSVRYFTAQVNPEPRDPDKPKRQSDYLQALTTLPDVHVHFGNFILKKLRCPKCGTVRTAYEEKMTDVNIAVKLLGDAQDDVFDTAMIVSADSDLAGPIVEVRTRYPDKRVVVAFPPDRNSLQLRKIASGYRSIRRNTCRNSQLPRAIRLPNGYSVTRPSDWD